MLRSTAHCTSLVHTCVMLNGTDVKLQHASLVYSQTGCKSLEAVAGGNHKACCLAHLLLAALLLPGLHCAICEGLVILQLLHPVGLILQCCSGLCSLMVSLHGCLPGSVQLLPQLLPVGMPILPQPAQLLFKLTAAFRLPRSALQELQMLHDYIGCYIGDTKSQSISQQLVQYPSLAVHLQKAACLVHSMRINRQDLQLFLCLQNKHLLLNSLTPPHSLGCGASCDSSDILA